MKFWVSFYWSEEQGDFMLCSPWWETGGRYIRDADGEERYESTVCAAIHADNVEDAEEIIYKAFDKRPDHVDFRFIDEKKDDWSPRSDRFPMQSWMVWA